MLVISSLLMMMQNTPKNSTKILINHGDLTLSAFIALIVSVFMTKAELIVHTYKMISSTELSYSADNPVLDYFVQLLKEHYIGKSLILNNINFTVKDVAPGKNVLIVCVTSSDNPVYPISIIFEILGDL
ncbi:hypothetical protein HI146_RS27855 [Escherichia coli]|nr:hypothetical protein [Escherichia coli]